MSDRDDFSEDVIRKLAARAGHQCSFPNCPTPTSGPSDESKESTSNTGTACHIISASQGPGARRRILICNADYRKSLENGIWMCSTHGRLIDNDEVRYSITTLRKWKELAEFRARMSQEQGRSISLNPSDVRSFQLSSETHSISCVGVGKENTIIGNALIDSCVSVIWGNEETKSVRDTLIELTRNAFHHGRATNVTLTINKRSITLCDDGDYFDFRSLTTLKNCRGGGRAIGNLQRKYSNKLITSYRRVDNLNEASITIAQCIEDVIDATPCTVRLNYENLRSEVSKLKVLDTCTSVYVICPDFLSLSDVRLVHMAIEASPFKERDVTVVFCDGSDDLQSSFEEFSTKYKYINL